MYDGESLPEDSLVVDVGGGVGTSALSLAAHFSKVRIVVQDLSGVIEDGKKVLAALLLQTLLLNTWILRFGLKRCQTPLNQAKLHWKVRY